MSLIVAWLCLMVPRLRPWLAPLSAYGLIGWGAAWIYPPAGPLSVGAVLWLDLFLYHRR